MPLLHQRSDPEEAGHEDKDDSSENRPSIARTRRISSRRSRVPGPPVQRAVTPPPLPPRPVVRRSKHRRRPPHRTWSHIDEFGQGRGEEGGEATGRMHAIPNRPQCTTTKS